MSASLSHRALAALLSYPGAELLAHGEELRAVFAADKRLGKAERASLDALIDHLLQGDLLELQGEYVDTFDRGRAASLNLFEHVHGDSRERGQAMVDLLSMYRLHELDLAVADLPDYLPVFLEFVSLLDEKEGRDQLLDVAHLIERIGATLTHRASPYAAVFEALLRLTGEKNAQRRLLKAAGTPVAEDRTPDAIDAAWVDEPVSFLGLCSPQQNQKQEQTIRFERRTA